MSEQSEPTADDQEPRQAPPPPRRRAASSPKRTPPPPRRGNGNGNGDDLVRTLLEQNAEILQRLERAESGGMRTVDPVPEPKPEIALTEAMSEFTRKLVERTHEVPDNYTGTKEPLYNVKTRIYLKPPPKNRPSDPPTYAELQGDSKNQAHYTLKGFYLLTPDEERHYRQVERPRLIQEQRARAALINAMRLLVKREATLSGYMDDAEWEDSLSGMSIDRLEEEWHTLCRQTPNPERRLPKAERVREERDAEASRLLSGVETVAPKSIVDALEQQAEDARRRSGRAVEVTPQNWQQFAT